MAFASGPRPIQTQLCVCLASLAIQMIAWKDVLATVASALGSNAGDCVLEFLKILPEEVTEGRKINLSVSDFLAVNLDNANLFIGGRTDRPDKGAVAR